LVCIDAPVAREQADSIGAPGSRWRPAILGLISLVTAVAVVACASASARPHRATRPTRPTRSGEAAASVRHRSITLVGDSLSILGRNQIWTTLPHAGWSVEIDAYPGRTTGMQLGALRRAAARHQSATLVELGTNDALGLATGQITLAQEAADLAAAVDLFDRQCVVWIEPDHDPQRRGADEGTRLDALLAQEARRHPNLHVADFGTVLGAHPEYLVADRTHLTPAGYRQLASFMTQALRACA
jgi:hypothetical protein